MHENKLTNSHKYAHITTRALWHTHTHIPFPTLVFSTKFTQKEFPLSHALLSLQEQGYGWS